MKPRGYGAWHRTSTSTATSFLRSLHDEACMRARVMVIAKASRHARASRNTFVVRAIRTLFAAKPRSRWSRCRSSAPRSSKPRRTYRTCVRQRPVGREDRRRHQRHDRSDRCIDHAARLRSGRDADHDGCGPLPAARGSHGPHDEQRGRAVERVRRQRRWAIDHRLRQANTTGVLAIAVGSQRVAPYALDPVFVGIAPTCLGQLAPLDLALATVTPSSSGGCSLGHTAPTWRPSTTCG